MWGEAENGLDEVGSALDAAVPGLEDGGVLFVGEEVLVCYADGDLAGRGGGEGGGGEECGGEEEFVADV